MQKKQNAKHKGANFDWKSRVKVHTEAVTNTDEVQPETHIITTALRNALIPVTKLKMVQMSWI